MHYILTFTLFFSILIFLELYALIKHKDKELFYLLTIQLIFIYSVLNINPIMGHNYRFLIGLIILSFIFAGFFLRDFKNKIANIIIIGLIIISMFIGFITSLEGTNYHANNTLILKDITQNISTKITAVGDVGIIGFYSDSKIIDLFLLNDAFMAHNGFNTSYILNQNPDIIILRSTSKEKFIGSTKDEENLYNHMQNYSVYEIKEYSFTQGTEYYWLFKKE
jgi:hypothetical protein